MTRGWQGRAKLPHYRCVTNASRPGATCKRHTIAARYADPLAIKLLARALTDPEQILALADAARTQEADATADMALAAARLASATERLHALAAERGNLMAALAALGALEGMDAEVATVRARLEALDGERAELDALTAQALSQRGAASDRAAFLRQMFSVRTWVANFATGEVTATGEPFLAIGGTMNVAQAAALLECTEGDIAALLPTTRVVLNDGMVEPDDVLTRDVVEQMLLRLSRDALRAVFRKLQAVVLVSRPYPRAARNGHWTRPEDRVALQLLQAVEVRTDDTKVSEFGQAFWYGS